MTAPARPPGAPDPPAQGWLARLFRRRSSPVGPLPVDDGSLGILARAFDVRRGDAAVLDELLAGGRDLSRPVVLRHVFQVRPGAEVTHLAGGLRADGYQVARPDAERLTAAAQVLLTPLAAAQARARMTGLTTRHPVEYLGWEALGPDA